MTKHVIHGKLDSPGLAGLLPYSFSFPEKRVLTIVGRMSGALSVQPTPLNQFTHKGELGRLVKKSWIACIFGVNCVVLGLDSVFSCCGR